jgi:hypothetical protein
MTIQEAVNKAADGGYHIDGSDGITLKVQRRSYFP